MRRAWAAITLLLTSFAAATVSDAADTYRQQQFINAATQEFESICRLLPPERRAWWQRNATQREIRRHVWAAEWDREDKGWVARRPDREEIESIRASMWLRRYGELTLGDAAALVEGAGSELLQREISARLTTRADRLHDRLVRGKDDYDRALVRTSIVEVSNLRHDFASLAETVPLHAEYRFEHAMSAYSEPELVGHYVAHRWTEAVAGIAPLERRLDTMERQLDVEEFFLQPRERRPWAVVSVQAVVLLVVIAGSLISFVRRPSRTAVAALAITSLFASLVLVFVSASTLLNMLGQTLVPCLFMLWWARDQPDMADDEIATD